MARALKPGKTMTLAEHWEAGFHIKAVKAHLRALRMLLDGRVYAKYTDALFRTELPGRAPAGLGQLACDLDNDLAATPEMEACDDNRVFNSFYYGYDTKHPQLELGTDDVIAGVRKLMAEAAAREEANARIAQGGR